ncbi:membrane protein [Streptomyces sp. NRRL WC-3753]|nr:membrane protein [Streptomyces sp. NRRL WC-3753]
MTARGWFLFSLMGVVWGIPYLMIKVAVDEVSPSGVVFTRCALGAALLLPFALRKGDLFGTVRRHWKPMLAFAVIEIIGPWWTLTDAERHLSSSAAGLLIAGVPIVGVLLALPHSRLRSSGGTPTFGAAERVGARRITGLGLGLGGVAVLTVPHLTGGDARSLAEVLVTPAVAVAAGALLLDEDLTLGIGVAFTLILAGSVLATAAAGPGREVRRVPWSTRQTSRAGGRVESLTGLPEERPGSTGQGDG